MGRYYDRRSESRPGGDRLSESSSTQESTGTSRICQTARSDAIHRLWRFSHASPVPTPFPPADPTPGAPMELRHLETLLAVAESGSFTGAADQLHTVQSNVSEQIRQLEDELGVSLFSRGRRGAVADRVRHDRPRARPPRPPRARGPARRPLDAPGAPDRPRDAGCGRHDQPLARSRRGRGSPHAGARALVARHRGRFRAARGGGRRAGALAGRRHRTGERLTTRRRAPPRRGSRRPRAELARSPREGAGLARRARRSTA